MKIIIHFLDNFFFHLFQDNLKLLNCLIDTFSWMTLHYPIKFIHIPIIQVTFFAFHKIHLYNFFSLISYIQQSIFDNQNRKRKNMKESLPTVSWGHYKSPSNIFNKTQIMQVKKQVLRQKINNGHFAHNISNLIMTRRQKTQNTEKFPISNQYKNSLNRLNNQLEDYVINTVQSIQSFERKNYPIVGQRKKYLGMIDWLKNCLISLQAMSKQKQITKEDLFQYMQNIYSCCLVDVINTIKIESKEKGKILQMAWENVINLLTWTFDYYKQQLQTQIKKNLQRSEQDYRKSMIQIEQLKQNLQNQVKARQKKEAYFYDVVKDNRILRRRNHKLILRLKYEIQSNNYLKQQNLTFYKQNEKMKMVISQENLIEQFLQFRRKIEKIERRLLDRKKVTKNSIVKQVTDNQIINKLGIQEQINLIIKRIDQQDLLDLEYYQIPNPQSLRKLYFNVQIQTEPKIQHRGTNTIPIPIKTTQQKIIQTINFPKFLSICRLSDIKIDKCQKKKNKNLNREQQNLLKQRGSKQVIKDFNKSKSSSKTLEENGYEIKLQKVQQIFIDVIEKIQSLKDVYNNSTNIEKIRLRKDNESLLIKIQKQLKQSLPFKIIFEGNHSDQNLRTSNRISRPSRNFEEFQILLTRRRNTTLSSEDLKIKINGNDEIIQKNKLKHLQNLEIKKKEIQDKKLQSKMLKLKKTEKKTVNFHLNQKNEFVRFSQRREQIINKTKKLVNNQEKKVIDQNIQQQKLSNRLFEQKTKTNKPNHKFMQFMDDNSMMSSEDQSDNDLQTIQQILTKKTIKSQIDKIQSQSINEKSSLKKLDSLQDKIPVTQHILNPSMNTYGITRNFQSKDAVMNFFNKAIKQQKIEESQLNNKKLKRINKADINNGILCNSKNQLIKSEKQRKNTPLKSNIEQMDINQKLYKIKANKNASQNLQQLLSKLTHLFPIKNSNKLQQENKYFTFKAITRIHLFINRSILKTKEQLLNKNICLKQFMQIKMENMYGFDEISSSVIKKIIKSLKKYEDALPGCKSLVNLIGSSKQNIYFLQDMFKIYILFIQFLSEFDQKLKDPLIPKLEMIGFIQGLLQIYFNQDQINNFVAQNIINKNTDQFINIYKIFNQVQQIIIEKSNISELSFIISQAKPDLQKKDVIALDEILQLIQMIEPNEVVINQNIIQLFFYCNLEQNGKRVIPFYKFCLFARKNKWNEIINVSSYIDSEYSKFYEKPFDQNQVLMNWQKQYPLIKSVIEKHDKSLQLLNLKIEKFVNSDTKDNFPTTLYKSIKIATVNRISNRELCKFVDHNVQIFSTCLIAHILKKQFNAHL